MAFTRKFLSSLGIDEEKIDTIITAHTEVTDALKADRDKYKEDAEKLPSVEQELQSIKDDGYKEKYEKEHKDFEAYKSAQDAKESARAKTSAFKKVLKEVGISDKRIDAVLKVSKDAINGIEFDDDGKIKGLEDLKKSVKDEWSEFVVKTEEHGTNTAEPPANTGGGGMTKAEIYKKDEKGNYVHSTAERQKAIAENPELFE